MKVKLEVEYNQFECPRCGEFINDLGSVLHQEADELQTVGTDLHASDGDLCYDCDVIREHEENEKKFLQRWGTMIGAKIVGYEKKPYIGAIEYLILETVDGIKVRLSWEGDTGSHTAFSFVFDDTLFVEDLT